MYSQNGECKVIQQYFDGLIGDCLSIGENDGRTYSNVLGLIENGWSATLVEPSSKVFPSLLSEHFGNNNVHCIQVAIGTYNGNAILLDSGHYLLKGTSSLLSTIIPSETQRWGDAVIWEESEVPVITFDELMKRTPMKRFDFISIDCEGLDYDVLSQINIAELECSCVCIEHNGVPGLKEKMYHYCATFGLTKILLTNGENIIIAK